MKEKDKLVGRSLKDLIEEHNVDKLLDNEIIVLIAIEDIKANPYQPRLYFDEDKLKELANSIKEYGVFQPIIVRKQSEGYIIVAGERRYRAATLAGKTNIPAVIRNYTDKEMAEISLVENLQREDISAIEEAKAYDAIIKDLKLTQTELAKRVSKSRSHITNLLGLLKLPEEVQDLVIKKELSMGHARTLSKLEDEERIKTLAKEIVKDNLTVREIEAKAFKELKGRNVNRKNFNRKFKVEREMMNKYYNSKVFIKDDRITFKIDDEEKLQELIERLIKNAI